MNGVEIRAGKNHHSFDAFLHGEYLGEIKSVKVSPYDRNPRYKITGESDTFDDLDEAGAFLVGRKESK